MLRKPSEAAARLGVSVETLEKWRCQGNGPRLPFIKLGTGKSAPIRYRDEDLDAVERENRILSGPEGREAA